MSFRKSRSVSLGNLHGGRGARSDAADASGITPPLERSKSFKSLTKKASFRLGSSNHVHVQRTKLTRRLSMKSLSNIVHKLVVRMSVSFPSNSVYTSGNEDFDENATYRRTDYDPSKPDSKSTTELQRSYRSMEGLGLSGLRNHGNTCFMNATVQCLAHTDLLAEYFVMDDYKEDIKLRKGQSKKFGTRGEVTEKLAGLLKSLWSSRYTPQVSSDFKNAVSKFGVQYRGYSQHDAQEFLLWLLDKVHEDLNRATKRKYKPNKDSTGRSDECIAEEALSNHMRSNNSFVLDLFQAQYRSSLRCPKCNQQSITFDPFICLSLPIPQRSSRAIIVTTVFLNSTRAPLRIGTTVPLNGSVSDLRAAVTEMTGVPGDSLILTEMYYDGFHRTFNDKHRLSVIREGDNIYAFEEPKSLFPAVVPMDCSPAIVSGSDGVIQDTILILLVNCVGAGKNGKRFGCPLVLRVLRELSFANLQEIILKSMSGSLQENAVYQERRHGLLFHLRVANGLAGKCYLSHEVDHPLYQATVDSALMSCSQGSGPPHIKIIAEWEPETKNRCIKPSIQDKPEEHCSVRQVEVYHNSPYTVHLEDCLKLYTKEEKLGPDDAWLCPRCKKLQQGTGKRLSLWTLPEILVVHLKRFKQTSAGRTKLHTLVDFPVSELDLTPHLEPRRKTSPENHSNAGWETWGRSRANSTSNPEENMYDLYAVCNHLGGMSGGHYTAYCKNSIDGQWYLFDDTNVEKTTYREVVTKGAYLLFYTRRNVGSSSASESSMGSDHWAWRMPRFSYESIASSEELEEPGRDKSVKPHEPACNSLPDIHAQNAANNWRNHVVMTESCV